MLKTENKSISFNVFVPTKNVEDNNAFDFRTEKVKQTTLY